MRDERHKSIRFSQIQRLMERQNLGKKLYHYTSLDALYGIFSKKELWLGNTADMNDTTEVTGFVGQLEQALLAALSSEQKDKCSKYFCDIYSRLEHEYPFALCLSRLADDAAQWERYASGGKGACIVFDTQVLMSALYYGMFIFSEVYYDGDIRDHQHYRELLELFSLDDTSLLKEKETRSRIDNILACGYIHKHRSFKSENEVRAATLWNSMPWQHEKGIPESECLCERCFVNKGGQIKEVIKLHLDRICTYEEMAFEDLFDGIIIGPRSGQSPTQLSSFLVSCGCSKLADEVERSDCPLR